MGQSLDRFYDEIVFGLLSLFGAWSEHVDEQDWAFDGTVGLLTVRAVDGSIAIRRTDQDRVTVHARKTVRGPVAAMVEAFSARVRVHTDRTEESVSLYTLYPRPPLGCSVFVRYQVDVPAAMDVVLSTQNGGIDIMGVEGAVEAEAWNGNIRLKDTLGPAKLRTSYGAIAISGMDGTVDAGSGAGRIDIRDATGHIQLHTTRGGISIVDSEGTIQARSYDGDITVRGGRGRAELETANGNITAGFEQLDALGVFVSRKGNVTIAVRDGSASIDVESMEGSVDLRLPAGFDGQVEAGTTDGAVHVDVPVDASLASLNMLAGRLGKGGSALVRAQAFSGDVWLRTWAPDVQS